MRRMLGKVRRFLGALRDESGNPQCEYKHCNHRPEERLYIQDPDSDLVNGDVYVCPSCYWMLTG